MPPSESMYVISLEEVLWGGLLMAISMALHGFGMLFVLRTSNRIKHSFSEKRNMMTGLFPIILATLMILIVHLTEVMVWASFFVWKGCFANQSVSFYFSLNEYTTVGSAYTLPRQWHLLEGMIAIAGLLGFAWSTGVLIALAQQFQEQQLEILKQRKQKRS